MQISSQTQSLIREFSWPANPFAGKFSCNWKDAVMVAGIAVAVTGAVASFFTGATLIGAAFAATTAVLVFSAFYVHNFNDGVSLQTDIGILRQENERLHDTQRRMEATAAQLGRQYNQIQGINRQLNQTITGLQTTTHTLQTENVTLAHNEQALQATANQLQLTNQSLQERVTAIQQAVPLLRAQVDTFVGQNVTLGNDLNVMNLDMTAIDQQNKTLASSIHGFDMTFNHDILDLSQAIHNAQTVSQTIFTTLSDQNKGLEIQVSTLHSSVGNLQNLEHTLQQCTTNLTATETRLQTETTSLQKTQKDLQATKDSLDQERAALASESTKLGQIQAQIAEDESKLELAAKEFNAFPAKLADAEHRLEEELTAIEQRKNAFITKLDQKISEKTQLTKDKNAELARLDLAIAARQKQLTS